MTLVSVTCFSRNALPVFYEINAKTKGLSGWQFAFNLAIIYGICYLLILVQGCQYWPQKGGTKIIGPYTAELVSTVESKTHVCRTIRYTSSDTVS